MDNKTPIRIKSYSDHWTSFVNCMAINGMDSRKATSKKMTEILLVFIVWVFMGVENKWDCQGQIKTKESSLYLIRTYYKCTITMTFFSVMIRINYPMAHLRNLYLPILNHSKFLLSQFYRKTNSIMLFLHIENKQ